MKIFLIITSLILSSFAKDFSIVIDKPFNSALYSIVQDYDRSISAIGFSKSYPSSKSDSKTYTNAFDYLSSISQTHGSQMHLVKLDKFATKQINQAVNLSKYNKAVTLVKTPHDGYYVGGYTLDGSLLISRLSAHGKIIFTKTFGTKNYDKLSDIILLKDGGIIAIGTSTTSRSSKDNLFETGLGLSDIYIAKFAQDGRKLWAHKYGTQYDDRGVSAVEAADGSIVIVGTTSNTENKKITLLRITGNGDKVWLNHYEDKNQLTPHKLIKLRDNNFLLSMSKQNDLNKEQVRLIKFNLQNNVIIDKEIFTSYSSVLKDIKEYSDGGIIGVGNVQDTYNTNALVMILDSSLNMQHQEHFGAQNYDSFNAVSILHNSQAAVAGTNTSNSSQESNMWIVKLNRDASMVQISTKIENYYKELQKIFHKEIRAKQLKIREDLSIEFIDKNLTFKQGKYQLTKLQKDFLKNFGSKLMPFLYTNKEFVSTLEINGHTSSEWGGANFSDTYLKNGKLSINRSYATLSHLYRQQNKATQVWLAKVLKGSGLSFSKQISFSNKVENKEKSRRVTLKILLTSPNRTN